MNRSVKYPIAESYPALFRDRYGEEQTTIRNDGAMLRMRIRNAEFSGWMLDDFEIDEVLQSDNLTTEDAREMGPFTLHRGQLCDCTIEYRAPLPMLMAASQTIVQASLHVHLELGVPANNGGLDKEILLLLLDYGGSSYPSSGRSGWFEDELNEIQAALPAGDRIVACINCAFSGYGIGGNGIFGCMGCFRDNRSAYLSAKTKADIFQLWNGPKEFVQETYVCPEFEQRQPGTGYRG